MFGWLTGSPRRPQEGADGLRFGAERITIDQLFSGVALIGATGSGKTSFMELLLLQLAKHPTRPGILWACAKSDEAARAEKIARKAGRQRDFIRFSADGTDTFNLFGYLQGPLKQEASGIARFCDRMAALASANSGSGNDKIWQTQSTLLLAHCLALFAACGQQPTPQSLFDVIISVPKDRAAAQSDEFLLETTCGQKIVKGQKRYQAGLLSPAEKQAFERAVNYVLTYAPGLGDRFLGSVIGTAATGLAPFLQPPFHDLFGSTKTTIPPDLLLDCAIIALDFPSVLGPSAYVAQAAYVQLAQMLLLSSPRGQRRPVVIVRDECQWLVSPDWDSRVQTIARSHGIISISACQGHAALIDAFGGDEAARVRATGFLGSHVIHVVFNVGADIETRDHYVKLAGNTRQMMYSGNSQHNCHPDLIDRMLGITTNHGIGWTEQLLPTIPPEMFTSLKRGGRDHRFVIEAMLFQPGRTFANGYPFTQIEFQQDITP